MRALTALANLEHRGAAGADGLTGDGAGILMQLPDAFFRGVLDAELPPLGRYGVAVCFLPHDEARRAELEQLLTDTVVAEGQLVVAWRDVPVDEAHVGRTAGVGRAADPAALRRRRPGARGRPGRLRAQALRDPPPGRARRGPRPRRADVLVVPSRLQGDAVGAAAAAVLHRPPRPAPRERARARPLALLHEHVPELGARPSLPADRAQRGDQHAAGERELDAGAGVAAGLGAVRRRPPEGAPRRPRRPARTRPSSTTCSSCSRSRGARCPTR